MGLYRLQNGFHSREWSQIAGGLLQEKAIGSRNILMK